MISLTLKYLKLKKLHHSHWGNSRHFKVSKNKTKQGERKVTPEWFRAGVTNSSSLVGQISGTGLVELWASPVN